MFTKAPSGLKKPIAVLYSLFDRLLPQGTLFRNIAVLAAGTVLGQGLIILSSPALARIYHPEDFGVFSIYNSILFIGLAVANLRFDMAIPVSKSKEEAFILLGISIIACITISCLIIIILEALTPVLPTLITQNSAFEYRWIIAPALLFSGMYQALTSLLLREKNYSVIARTKPQQGIAQVGIQLIFPFYGATGAWGLLIGDALGRNVGSLSLIRNIKWNGFIEAWRNTNIPKVLISYKAFPGILLIAALINVVSQQLLPIFFPIIFGMIPAGYFFLAQRSLSIPAQLLVSSTSQVMFAEIASSQESDRRIHVLKAAEFLFLLSLPIYGGACILSPSCFPLLFGPQWTTAGIYASLIAPTIAIWMVASSLSSLLVIGQRFLESLAFTMLDLTTKIFALAVGYHYNSPLLAIFLYALSGTILSFISIKRFINVINLKLSEFCRLTLFKAIKASLVPLILVSITTTINPHLGIFTWIGSLLYMAKISKPKYQAIP